jgi:hypothetical protein
MNGGSPRVARPTVQRPTSRDNRGLLPPTEISPRLRGFADKRKPMPDAYSAALDDLDEEPVEVARVDGAQ